MAAETFIKVYTNNDDAVIIWKFPAFIKDCWGFAVFRKRKGESDADAEPVHTSVGFHDDPHVNFEMRPSTEWPVQKYIWIDYFVKKGDQVSYRIVPMLQKDGTLVKNTGNATAWSDEVTIGDNGGAEAYFNRGLVSSQFLARRFSNVKAKEWSKTLAANLADVNSDIRRFMGGNLLDALHSLLDGVIADENLSIYAALYELDEFELMDKLNTLGKRAHIILANGAFTGSEDPQAAHAEKIKDTDLTRRKVKTPHFAHNKFIVVTDKKNGAELPVKVFTGSTNWTTNGVFTQVNNAVVLHDTKVADYFLQEWKAIKADCSPGGMGLYSDAYKKHNNTSKSNDKGDIETFFTPVPNTIDMDKADSYIKAAKQGILFLMFKPGIEHSSRMLYDTIMKMAENKDLLVQGVLNADPGGSGNPTITFTTSNNKEEGDLDAVLPAGIDQTFGFWMDEVGKKNVTIHSKAIVIDPFSDNPVLMTGSHNMGDKASRSNDDNLNIITGDKMLAQAYAINMMSVYHHYRWRFYRSKQTGTPKWDGNIKSDDWQHWYDTGEKANEIRFWLGNNK